MTDDSAILDSFAGRARLFPLPNLVLFPGIDQGLHIFEHRYRQMTADALASDGLIALVLLQPDWHDNYDGAPGIEAMACLARIVGHERLIDGRYNLRVRGVARFEIDAEISDDDKLYRIASGRIVHSIVPGEAAELRRKLRDTVLARFDSAGPAFAHLAALFSSDSPLDRVCDQLGYSLPMPLSVKQKLLDEPSVAGRVDVLSAALTPAGRQFPPPFSSN